MLRSMCPVHTQRASPSPDSAQQSTPGQAYGEGGEPAITDKATQKQSRGPLSSCYYYGPQGCAYTP